MGKAEAITRSVEAALAEHGRSPADVMWVGSIHGSQSMSWAEFAGWVKRKRVSANRVTRALVTMGCTVVGDGWWLEAKADDHWQAATSPVWEYHEPPMWDPDTESEFEKAMNQAVRKSGLKSTPRAFYSGLGTSGELDQYSGIAPPMTMCTTVMYLRDPTDGTPGPPPRATRGRVTPVKAKPAIAPKPPTINEVRADNDLPPLPADVGSLPVARIVHNGVCAVCDGQIGEDGTCLWCEDLPQPSTGEDDGT